jgi:hypothetical protein
VTPLPLIEPTDTPTATPTDTPTPTLGPPTDTPPPVIPTLTPRPPATATRTLSPDELAEQITQPPTFTAVPPSSPTRTLAATLDSTPTFITAEATISDLGIITATPIPATTTPEGPTVTPTLPSFPTVAPIDNLPPTLEFAPRAPTLVSINTQTRAFALSTSGGFSSGGFSLLGDATLFERNPADPSQYAVTNSAGSLFVTGVGGAGAQRIDISPFSRFEPLSRAENNAFVADIAWSPDGRYLAFLVDADQLLSDGVWFFDPGGSDPLQLLIDCHQRGFVGCQNVNNPVDPDLWESLQIVWSPSSDAILVRMFIPSEGRTGLVVLPVTFAERARDTRPPVLRYEFGSWERSGQRILVSGSSPDGSVFVAWLNRDGSLSEMVFDARAVGLWMGYANQSSGGEIYALGAPGGPGSGLSIYNMQGQALTGTIGSGQPQRVEWSPDGRGVYVEVGGRQYVAFVTGEVRDITGSVAGARAVNWVSGILPPSEETGTSGAAPLPSGVIAGSQYQPGEQRRVYSDQLNVRTGPGYSYDFARGFLVTGEYVRILAGPVEAEGATWWQVQTADGSIGWVAGAINGVSTLGP